jgi:hypothetical protein
MKQLSIFLLVIILGLTLSACGTTQKPATPEQSSSTLVPQPSVSQDLNRSDAQGAITIDVKPDNLSSPGDTLVFEISMNTHSIDLNMDLATLATLTTDNGHTIRATLWDAPRGGHHVSGMLSFPANVDGKLILDGTTKLTLTIKDVDAPQRVFSWDFQK